MCILCGELNLCADNPLFLEGGGSHCGGFCFQSRQGVVYTHRTRTHAHTDTHTRIFIHTHAYARNTHTCTRTRTRTRIACARTSSTHTCMHVCFLSLAHTGNYFTCSLSHTITFPHCSSLSPR